MLTKWYKQREGGTNLDSTPAAGLAPLILARNTNHVVNIRALSLSYIYVCIYICVCESVSMYMCEPVRACVVCVAFVGEVGACSSAFPERNKMKPPKKNVRLVLTIADRLVFGVLQSGPQSCSLCHRLSSLHHGWVCFIFVEEGEEDGVGYRPPGQAYGLGARELFWLTRYVGS